MIFIKMTLVDYWRQLLLNICEPIYKLIVYLYELFEVVGTAEVITNESLTILYNRVGLLLGIYMLFRILFSFIQMLINPDYISDKEKGAGKIAIKAILTIVLIAITPFIFEKALELQNFIVGANGGNNVIANIILPTQDVSDYEEFGPTLSAYLFDSFYRFDDAAPQNKRDKCDVLKPYTDGQTKLHESIVRNKGSVSYASLCLYDDGKTDYVFNDKENGDERYTISFTWNGVFAILAGGMVCYMLLTYILSVGARVIQLAFLRIISPMAIMTFLSPKKDSMFSKWLKMCATTYLDLFIRMAIIYFIVFMISTIMSSETGIALAKPFEDMWIVNIVMILALLIFGKKAPELLKELFPSSGSAASLGFGLKSPKKMFDDMLGGSTLYKAGRWTTRGAAGLAGGALLGAGAGLLGADHKLSGMLGGALRGGFTGIRKGGIKKVVGNQRDINAKYRKMHADGANWFDMKKSSFQQAVGINTAGQKMQLQYDAYDDVIKRNDDMEQYLDKQVMKYGEFGSYVQAAQQKYDSLKEQFKNPIAMPKEVSKADFIITTKDGKKYFNKTGYEAALVKYNEALEQRKQEEARRGQLLAAASQEVEDTKKAQRKAYMESTKGRDDQVLTGKISEYDYAAKQAGITIERDNDGKITFEGIDSAKTSAKNSKANISASAEFRRQKAADEASGKK